MLNTGWAPDTDIAVKEELGEDAVSSPGSPHQLCHPAPLPLSPHYFYAADTADPATCLHTLVPLPPFPQLQLEPPESPGPHQLATISISELSSPDSSSMAAAAFSLHPAQHSLDAGADSGGVVSGGGAGGGRKRSNSGSSGSSDHSGSCGAGAGQHRPKIRRRQPLSQDELNNQRNQGRCQQQQHCFSLNSY